MNYKQLFPTYRTRYLFVEKILKQVTAERKPAISLNLGCGEGEYDLMISKYTSQLISCDLNQNDIAFARSQNQKPEITYRVENAEQLSFPDNYFDLIISVDVYEHVSSREKMVAEIFRTLKPGGKLIITFPSVDFPVTYDPVNYFMQKKGKKFAFGAYSFGHYRLPVRAEFEKNATGAGLHILEKHRLTHYLAALPEIYWVGFLQRFFKDNSENVVQQKEKKIKLRPSYKPPFLSFVTDMIIKTDSFLFGKSGKAVTSGYLLTKQN